MAVQTVKIAVSLPKEQFRQIEQLRRQLKLSRSAMIARAIQQFLVVQEPQRGSPEALLPYAGSWVFAPEELECLLADIEQMREMELAQ